MDFTFSVKVSYSMGAMKESIIEEMSTVAIFIKLFGSALLIFSAPSNKTALNLLQLTI